MFESVGDDDDDVNDDDDDDNTTVFDNDVVPVRPGGGEMKDRRDLIVERERKKRA